MDTSKELFIQTYEDVKRLNHSDLVSSDLRFAKTLEEIGELFQTLNKVLGRKVGTRDPQELRAEVLEESSDTIQCIYSLVEARVHFEETELDITQVPGYLTDLSDSDNSVVDWMDDLLISISHLRKIRLTEQRVAVAMDSVIEIARQHGITLDEIHQTILNVKNPKWEKSLETLKATS